MRRLSPIAVLGLLSLASACGEPSERHGSDSGAPSDAGRASDAGGTLDAGGALDSGTSVDAGPCVDVCPAPDGGLVWGCEKRFAYGANWAWSQYAADFGGIAAWGQTGVAANEAALGQDLGDMKDAGVDTLRWWMFPRFYGDGVTFDAQDAPTGLGGTVVADVQAALTLAEQHDVYIVFTLFSFDNFNPTQTVGGINTPGLAPIATSTTLTQQLATNVVAPIAQVVAASPYAHRVLAWDVINEPEWAMTGPDMYGGEAFTPTSGLQALTHAQMEAFIDAVADALHANSAALVTVGSAAIKWAPAWTHAHLDFYQLHYYGWVYQYYPYWTVTLESVGLTDKPAIIGEFPITGLAAVNGMPSRTLEEFANDMWNYGYAGTLTWAYNDSAFPWSAPAVQPFAGLYPCQTAY